MSALPDRTPPHDPGPAASATVRDLTLLDLVNVVLRYRRAMIVLPLLCMGLGVASGLLTRRTYRADAAFILQGGSDNSRVAGLAAQFGISVPGSGGDDAPQLYADLLTSRRLLTSIADTRFSFTSRGQRYSGTYTDLLLLRKRTAADTRQATLEALKLAVSSRANPLTGVVGFSVSTPWPELSEAIAARLVELVNEFNVSTRQSQAAAERRFTEQRLQEARGELRQAEDALQAFLDANHSFQGAPRLMLTHERLQRQVAEREAVFTMITQAYERARIDEVRDTPVLTMVELPQGSARRVSRDTVLRGVLAALLGLVLAVVWAFWRDALRRSRERSAPELQEFMVLREQALRGIPVLGRGAARARRGA